MTHLNFSYEKALPFIGDQELNSIQSSAERMHQHIHEHIHTDNAMLGWVELPETHNKAEFAQIKRAAEKIRSSSDILLVIGVGGSYLGARAAIEALSHNFFHLLDKENRNAPQVIFVGNHLSATYITELFDILEKRDFSINIISKSGTTTEPSIAFRIFEKYLIKQYGEREAKERIFVTTDKEKGALKAKADERGYETFVVPDNIGGRYSVLTAVGLLPIAACGISIDKMMSGAQAAMIELSENNFHKNPASQYAAIRNILYSKGKMIEILVHDEPNLTSFAGWWKQLFGESEGKNGKGIFPASSHYTSDLHSIGQYIQDGERNLFETTLHVSKPRKTLTLEEDEKNTDGLNYLAGNTIDEINDKAMLAAALAHTDGGVPNLSIEIPSLDVFSFGYLVYFFEKACAISGFLLGVDPFNQPGVEAYKQNMHALLGKAGFENKKDALEKRLR